MSRPSTFNRWPGRKLFPAVRVVVRVYKFADMVGSTPRLPVHGSEIMVQLHKASLVEPSFHSQKMLDLLNLTISKDLIRE